MRYIVVKSWYVNAYLDKTVPKYFRIAATPHQVSRIWVNPRKIRYGDLLRRVGPPGDPNAKLADWVGTNKGNIRNIRYINEI